ncbi:MAG: TetR/AcrR family transcriptional regulator [Pseudomonadota bacterium]
MPTSAGQTSRVNYDLTRGKIIRAAYELFVAGGQGKVGLREIAKRLGVSAMMPYKYFPSKDHIMMELRLGAFDEFSARLAEARKTADGPESALRGVCSAYLSYAQEHPNAYRLMFDLWEFDRQDEIDRDFGIDAKREMQSWRVNREAVAAFAQAQGLEIDVDLGAHVVWAALHGLASLHLARKLAFGLHFDDLHRPLIDSIVEGLKRAS